MARGRLLLIFLLAAALRVPCPRLTYFTADQARDLRQAEAVLRGRGTLLGPAIGQTGLHLGPFYYYFLAPALAVSSQPAAALVWLALGNSLGVVLWTILAGAVLGARAGFWAGLFLALHPLAALHGRTLWNPALVVPATAVFALGLWLLRRGRFGGANLLWPGAALMLQAHAPTAALLPLTAAAGRRLFCLRRAWPGLLLAALLTLPWAAWDAGRLLTGRAQPERHVEADRAGVSYPRALLRALAPEAYLPDRTRFGPPLWEGFVRGGAYAFAFLVLLGAWRLLVRGGEGRWLVLGALLPTVCVPLLPRHAYYYYLEAAFPWRCLLGAAGLSLWRRPWAFAVALPGLLHLLGALYTDAATGLLRGGPGSLDLRAPGPEGTVANRIPTWAAKRAVGKLLRRLGYRVEDLERCAHGPWWRAFVDDGGYWLRAGGEAPAPAPPGALLLLHEADGHPRPGPRQLLGAAVAGPFRLYRLRTALRDLQVEVPGQPPSPLPAGPAVLARFPWAAPAVTLRARLTPAPPAKLVLCAAAGFGARPEAFAAAGRRLPWSGGFARQGFTVRWVAWTNPPGEAPLSVRLRAPPRRDLPLVVDLYDIWPQGRLRD